MLEETINLWTAYDASDKAIACITTNGFVKRNGECVMGRGCAKEARDRFRGFASQLGRTIAQVGNHVVYHRQQRLVTFPTKHVWWEKSDPKLIQRSAEELAVLAAEMPDFTFYLPRPGCGNGKLDWAEIKPMVASILPDNVVVVNYTQAGR